MSAILFWIVIKPLSLLPYWILYGISDFFFVVIYYLVGYRKKVVYDNLRKAFPEKSEMEINELMRRFYRHFCDIVVESLKNFSISEKQAQERLRHINPEIFEPYKARGQSVIIAGGHYGNWELWAVTAAAAIPHKVVAIYKRLSNKYFDAKMRVSRGRFGLEMVPTREIGDYIRLNSAELNAVVFAVDQSPSNPRKALWINFLGRETAALFGTEKYSVMYDRPVIFGHLHKIKRGFYEVRYELVSEHPAETDYGYLTEELHRRLEKDIRRAPEFWLWSHKRWKHKRPVESAETEEVGANG